MKSFFILILSLTIIPAIAQVRFEFDQSIEVRSNGSQLKRPFEGGFNSAQFQMMDLNGDEIEDLVVFHRISRSISTYLNSNGEWLFSPEYVKFFPEDVVNWVVLKDFDCDGKNDLFTSTALGIKVYRNISSSNNLQWEVAEDFLTSDTGSNIQVSATDIPGFADVNGDGALDILTYRFGSSSSIDYYQNNGTCGDLSFTRVTRTWGEFFDCGCGDFSFGAPCATPGEIRELPSVPSEAEVILHAGGKTILPFDADNDGDIDIITSDELCERLVFLENDGTPSEARITSFANYPMGDPVNFQFFPSAFLIDIDLDGVDELVTSTNIDSNPGNLVNFQTNIMVYENSYTNLFPQFENPEPFLQNEMIDVGEDAFPTFHDFDEDGDLDMFIGNTGLLNNQEFAGSIALFENIGNQFNPVFELSTTDFQSFSSLGYTHLKPQFSDLNNDGIIDLLLQAKVGPLDSRIFILEGKENSSFNSPLDLGIDVSDNDNPFLFDLNSDGLKDLMVGKQFGSLSVFLNEGSFNFSDEQSGFGDLENDFTKQNLSLTIGQFNSSGGPQILTIDSQGKLSLYNDQPDENFKAVDFEQNLIQFDEELSLIDFGRASYLATADLHGDGLSSLVIGSSKGGLYFLRNKTNNDPNSETELRVSISPNPSNSVIRILANSDVLADIIDLNGKVIEANLTIKKSVVKELQFELIPSGVYIIRLRTDDGQTLSKRVLIQP